MKKIEKIYEKFKSEQEIQEFFSDKPIHCVKCHEDFDGAEEFDHELKNSLAIPLFDGENKIVSVPRLCCRACGYRNTVLKLLYQTV